MAEPTAIYKKKNLDGSYVLGDDGKTPRLYEQDRQWDSWMRKPEAEGGGGYEAATPDEEKSYRADKRPARPVLPQTQENIQDEFLAKEIERAATTAGEPITPDEARKRAATIRGIMGERPVYPEPDDMPVEQAGDSGFAVLQGVLGGPFLGAGRFALRKAIDAYDAQNPTEPPSAFSSQEMERREKLYPRLVLGSEIASSLGTSALKTAGVKLLERGLEAGALQTAGKVFLELADAGTGIFKGASKLAARPFAGSSAAALKGASEAEISAVLAKEATGGSLTEAEKRVLDIAREVARGDLATTTTAAGRTIAAPTKGLAAATEERAAFLYETEIANSYKRAGFSGPAATQMAKVLLGRAGAIGARGALAAGAGGIAGTAQDFFRTAANPQNQQSISEDLAASTWRGGGTGALVGGGLSLGIPVVSKSFEYGLRAVRAAGNKIAEKIIPAAGSLLTEEDPTRLRGALTAGAALGDRNINRDVREFARALDFQYNNASSYLAHLNSLRSEVDPAVSRAYAPLQANLATALDDVRKELMVLSPDGTYKFSTSAVNEAIKKAPLIQLPDGSYRITLPPSLQNLQNEIQRWEYLLAQIENAEEAAAARAGAPSPSRDFRSRRVGGIPFTEEMRPAPNVGEVGLAQSPISPSSPLMSPLGNTPEQMAQILADPNKYPTPLRIIPETYERFGKAQQLERLTLPDPTAQKTAFELAGTAGLTYLLDKAGLSFGESAVAAAALAQSYKLLIDPRFAIGQAKALNKLAGSSLELNKALRDSLVVPSSGRAAAADTMRRLVVDRKRLLGYTEEEITESEKPFSPAAARQLYLLDRDLIKRLSSGDAVGDIDRTFGHDYRKLDASYPIAGNITEQVTPKQVAFLNSKMPRVPQNREPTNQQVFQYGLYSRYVREPDAVYDDIRLKRYVPSQAVEVLKELYPTKYKQLQQSFLDSLASVKERGEEPDKDLKNMANTILTGMSGYRHDIPAAEIRRLQNSVVIPKGNRPSDFTSRRVELEKEGTTLGK